ncbi:hypothetical protein [Streptomyces sp. NPDC053069]|uniref:hypothetical protein n=1 Tax=Streptomyces sp. NPDC053069 TaxID=3365695 RepID=UPI0037D83F0C
MADVLFQVGVGFLVDAAVGLGLEARYQWAAVVFLVIGAGGVLALQRATALVKLVSGPLLATLAAAAAPTTPHEDGPDVGVPRVPVTAQQPSVRPHEPVRLPQQAALSREIEGDVDARG